MAQTNEQMQSPAMRRPVSRGEWAGRVMSGLVVVFMLFASAVPKLFMPEVSNPTMVQLGWPMKYTLLIACIEIAGALLYAIPKTAVLGAIVLTALFGAAVATHLRVGNPVSSHVLFSVYLGVIMWGGLWLRDARVRALVPIRTVAE
jgi:DoxX-like family